MFSKITIALLIMSAGVAHAQSPAPKPASAQQTESAPAKAAQKWVGLEDIKDEKTGQVYNPTGLSNETRWQECLAEGGTPFADKSRARASGKRPGDREIAITYRGCPSLIAKARAEDAAAMAKLKK